jgi:hypothetical protein
MSWLAGREVTIVAAAGHRATFALVVVVVAFVPAEL